MKVPPTPFACVYSNRYLKDEGVSVVPVQGTVNGARQVPVVRQTAGVALVNAVVVQPVVVRTCSPQNTFF